MSSLSRYWHDGLSGCSETITQTLQQFLILQQCCTVSHTLPISWVHTVSAEAFNKTIALFHYSELKMIGDIWCNLSPGTITINQSTNQPTNLGKSSVLFKNVSNILWQQFEVKNSRALTHQQNEVEKLRQTAGLFLSNVKMQTDNGKSQGTSCGWTQTYGNMWHCNTLNHNCCIAIDSSPDSWQCTAGITV